MKVKIVGSGSIGNHHARACRTMGWDVDMVDKDSTALLRMKDDIYPKRYGVWDEAIRRFTIDRAPKGIYDIIMIDVPPDVRMDIAYESLNEQPKLLHLEKPLCQPSLRELERFYKRHAQYFQNMMVTVGYNHAVSKSVERVVEIIKSDAIGEIITIEVEFREHWEGIFKAHPWLKGPEDSYLGYWERGGGAGGEHSHALHLWLYLAYAVNLGVVTKVESDFDMVDGKYDRIATFILRTRNGKVGRVVQDVVKKPPRKWARIHGTKGFIEWHCNNSIFYQEGDMILGQWPGESAYEHHFKKTRQDDFLWLIQHYNNLLSGKASHKDSPLHIDFGMKVMDILHDAYYQ